MGQSFSQGDRRPELQEETKVFASWNLSDVKELLKRFRMQVHGFAIVEAQFESILSFKENIGKHVPLDVLFETLDNDHDGRIDGLELLGGLALCCQASFEEKARFCFELYDFNLNATMSKKEMIMMMMTSISGMNILTGSGEGLEPDIDATEAFAEDAFLKADRDQSGQISFEEFIVWARSNRELMAKVESLTRIGIDVIEKIDSEDSAQDVQEAELSDALPNQHAEHRQHDHEQQQLMISAQSVVDSIVTNKVKTHHRRNYNNNADEAAAVQWKGQVYEPTNFKQTKNDLDGPDTNLELCWAYGFRTNKCRNNLRYVNFGTNDSASEVVYTTAALGVVFDTSKRTQRFYDGHQDEVTALAVHPSGKRVATSDKSGMIHVWNAETMVCEGVIEGIVKTGIQLLTFSTSPYTTRIATVGTDSDHTVAVYDWKTLDIVSSAKGMVSPHNALDIAYSRDGSELAMVGTKSILFFQGVDTSARAMESVVGKIGSKGKKQTFFCVTYTSEDAIVGCASGDLYRFQHAVCVQIVQAHGIDEPVLSIFYHAKEEILVTGGKDAVVKTWDHLLKEVGSHLDMSESIDSNSDNKSWKSNSGGSAAVDSAVTSVQLLRDRILVGTRGSDMFEARMPVGQGGYSLNRIGCGHCAGKLRGLAAHPSRDEFATCGDDRTIRIWSIRSHEQITFRSLPAAGHCLSYSPKGESICVGLADGTVALMEADSSSLRVYSMWKHCAEAIAVVVFSPDGFFVAVGSEDGNIYVYRAEDKKNFLRHAVCRGHGGSITHLDFSSNSQYIQSNSEDLALLYWDTNGNQVKPASLLRDVPFSNPSCTFSWATQGIWPINSDYTDVLSCMAMPEVGDIVTGDIHHRVNLFRYPSLTQGSIHQSYVGHAGKVTAVTFNYNRRFVISIGGYDGTILLWSHEVENSLDTDDEDNDDANSNGSQTSSSSVEGEEDIMNAVITGSDFRKEIVVVADDEETHRCSLLQEAVNLDRLQEDLVELIQMDFAVSGSENIAVQPWKSTIIEPTVWKKSLGTTDCDLTLEWIHGYRAHDCRNNVLYNAAGAVVYPAAAVALVYSKSTGKQKFLQGAHIDDVIGICVHPSGQLFATGETGRHPTMVVWSSQDMRVIVRIEGCHRVGVPLLAFNSRGNLLASIGLDRDKTLVIHDWDRNIQLLRTPTDKGKVLCMCFLATKHVETTASTPNGDAGLSKTGDGESSISSIFDSEGRDVVVTAGEKHVKFWWAQGQNVKSQKGLWGKEKRDTIMTVASASAGVCITGSTKGEILVWKNFQVVSNVRKHMTQGDASGRASDIPMHCPEQDIPGECTAYPHNMPIQAIWCIPGTRETIEAYHETRSAFEVSLNGFEDSERYITADRSGVIAIWRLFNIRYQDKTELRLKLAKQFNISSLESPTTSSSVRSICERQGTLLIGTHGAEILEINLDDIPFVNDGSTHGPSALSYSTYTGGSETLKGKLSKTLKGSDAARSDEEQRMREYERAFLAKAEANQSAQDILKQCKLRSQRLISGHSRDEVWGLAVHPTLPVYFTSGDDTTVRCWSAKPDHRLISYIQLPEGEKVRAIDVLPTDGSELAIALNSGNVWILAVSDFINPRGKKGGLFVDPSLNACHLTIDPEMTEAARARSLLATESGGGGATASKPTTVPGPKTVVAQEVSSLGDHDHTPLAISEICILPQHARQWAQEIKYSFDGSFLALASHDRAIYLYRRREEVDKDGGHSKRSITYEFVRKMPKDNEDSGRGHGHATYITHIDFGVIVAEGVRGEYDPSTKKFYEQYSTGYPGSGSGSGDVRAEVPGRVIDPEKDICLQSSCAAYELLFWRMDGTRIESPSVMKDTWWATWTTPIGWPVQGIWPPSYDGMEINAVARSHSWSKVPVLATADGFGRVKLYSYPCVEPGAPDKCYKGHSRHVTNIRFTYNDNYCISVGGVDKCVFVWATDIEDEIREREALRATTDAADDASSAADKTTAAAEESYLPFKAEPSAGDEFRAVKPWKGSIREPSDWTDPPDLGELPVDSLELKFVYGYRGWDCRNNIGYADSSDEVVYHISGVGIVYDSSKHTQILNTEHDNDILCLAVHPDGHTVATGEAGKRPKIVLWDANTGVTIKTLLYHKNGISGVSFSGSGSLLISVGMNPDRTIAVHNIKTGSLVGKGKGGRGIEIYCIAVCEDSTFVTAGKNHIKFWEMPTASSAAGELQSKAGLFGKTAKARTVVSASFLGADVVTGMADGSLVLWKERSTARVREGAHTGAITAMCPIRVSTDASSSSNAGGSSGGGGNSPSIASGGKDGMIYIWNVQLAKTWAFNIKTVGSTASGGPRGVTPSVDPQVQALATRDGMMLIGTKGAEIYEVNLMNANVCSKYVHGHNQRDAELWGLSVHPTASRFVTAGDDQMLRTWDSRAMIAKESRDVGAKVRAVAYNYDGSHIAATTFDGRLIVFEEDLSSIIASVTIAATWSQTMRFSPDGNTLAIGCHDSHIYLFDTKSMSCRAKCQGHSSFLTAIDFSEDSSTIRTCSGDYELLFWSSQTGKQILSATTVRDVKWSTTSCPFGWAVQGIWAPDSDGLCVNAVDCSPDRSCIVSGDDNKRVKLFKFPSPRENAKCREYRGHSEHVVNVRFTSDGKSVLSVGGLDKAIMQYDVKAPSGSFPSQANNR